MRDWKQLARDLVDPTVSVQMPEHLRDLLGYHHLPAGWSSEHWRATPTSFTLYLVERGAIAISGHRETVIGPGMALAVSPRVADMQATFSPGIRYHEIWFRPHRDGRTLRVQPDMQAVAAASDMLLAFEQVAFELAATGGRFRTTTRHWLALLLAMFTEQTDASAHPAPHPRRLSTSQCLQLTRWVREHAPQSPAPSGMARALGLSHDYFTRLFGNTYGIPPRRWLAEERIRLAAQQLILTDQPVARIADALGYTDASHFTRLFTRLQGLTPRAYRRANQRQQVSSRSGTGDPSADARGA